MSTLISKTECYKIIHNYLNLENTDTLSIHDYEMKQKIGEVTGFMGEYYGLKIRYSILNSDQNVNQEPVKTDEFFVKLIPVTNPLHKKEIEEKGFFEKEIGIYTNILKELERYCDEKYFARCLYSRSDMMVLEDLTKIDYKNLKDDQSYTIAHFETVLKSQASLHVASMLYEQKTGINIGEKFGKFLEEKQVTIKNSWYAAGLEGIKTVCKLLPKYQNEKYQRFFDTKLMDYLTKAEEKVKVSKVYHNVLCHRDSWDKNILFKTDSHGKPIGCAFVDFQLTRYTPPAIDVLFFIYMNTRTKERGQILEHCLRFYYDDLEDKIKKYNVISNDMSITWIEFVQSCEDINVVVLILCAMCYPLTYLPTGWADEMKQTDQNKFSYYMTVNRNEMLINLINQYDYYKNILFEAHEELVEYILNDINGNKKL